MCGTTAATQTHKNNPSFSWHLLCFYVTEQESHCSKVSSPVCTVLSFRYPLTEASQHFVSLYFSPEQKQDCDLPPAARGTRHFVPPCCDGVTSGPAALSLSSLCLPHRLCAATRMLFAACKQEQRFFFGSPNTARMIKWHSGITTHYLTDQPSDTLDVIWVFGLLKAASVADCVIKLNCLSRRNSVKWLW